MSASSPISLLEDDETDQQDKSRARPQNTTHQEEAAIQMFLQVMGSQDRDFAIKLLSQVGFDVSRAVSLVFEGRSEASLDDDSRTASSTSQQAFSQSNAASNACPVKSLHEEKPVAAQKLSPEWYRCHQHSQNAKEQFVDPDFPPTQNSLDGRKHTSTDETNNNVVKCLCGIPATARAVQTDGPNYGRFYLSCGQPRRRRRTNIKDDNASPLPQPCKFFQWDKEGSRGAGYASRYAHLAWHQFGPPSCVLYRKQISPDQVRQGAVGNCWFLSALAVVAEKEYLVKQLLPHASLNETGCYQVNLCLDGKWTPIIIDSSLPVLFGDDDQTSAKKRKLKGGQVVAELGNLVACPAFAAVPDGQLWPALVEKAYAKTHGSYAQLSGGFVAEALSDMTGAPTETIVFGNSAWCDAEELWARLLSFSEAGFLMGVATSRGGDGLVGNHAYSVLEVIEFHDSLVGAQQKVTDFFTRTSPDKKQQASSKEPSDAQNTPRDSVGRTTIRLVRIRNPWGTREWKGEWSAGSEQWTTALRKRLGDKSYAKGDGTFFMSFENMMERFHHMDVAKCREGWRHCSLDGCFQQQQRMCTSSLYRIRVDSRTWAFISLIQPKKRANTKSQYWYADPSMLILKRKRPADDWSVESSALHGCTRSCSCEIFLDPALEYCVVPFSHHARASAGSPQGAPFRVTAYSSAPVKLEPLEHDHVNDRTCLETLHRVLLGIGHKLHYVVAPKGLLICIHGQECLYFMALNSAPDHFLSLRLTVEEKKGLLFMGGQSKDTFDIPPRSQAILMVVSSTGADSSAAASVTFSYASDVVPTKSRCDNARTTPSGPVSMRSTISISMAGDLLASEVNPGSTRNKGGDTVETNLWLSQVGSIR